MLTTKRNIYIYKHLDPNLFIPFPRVNDVTRKRIEKYQYLWDNLVQKGDLTQTISGHGNLCRDNCTRGTCSPYIHSRSRREGP